MSESTEPKSASPSQQDAMLGLIGAFLQNGGWDVVVIGGCRIQKPAGERDFIYEFVVRFTGSPIEGFVKEGTDATK